MYTYNNLGVADGAPPPWAAAPHPHSASAPPAVSPPSVATAPAPILRSDVRLKPGPGPTAPSWRSAIDPSQSNSNLAALDEKEMDNIAKNATTKVVLNTWTGNDGLPMISTATGDAGNGSIAILHNPKQRTNSSKKSLWTALSGLDKKATMVEIDTAAMLRRKTVNVPETAEMITKGPNNFKSLLHNCVVQTKCPTSSFATPPIFNIVKDIKDLSADTFFEAVHGTISRDMLAHFLSGAACPLRSSRVRPRRRSPLRGPRCP